MRLGIRHIHPKSNENEQEKTNENKFEYILLADYGTEPLISPNI